MSDNIKLPPLELGRLYDERNERTVYTRKQVLDYARAAVALNAPTTPPKLSDTEIEMLVQGLGLHWSGDRWVIEDADMHPMVRALLYRYTDAPAGPEAA